MSLWNHLCGQWLREFFEQSIHSGSGVVVACHSCTLWGILLGGAGWCVCVCVVVRMRGNASSCGRPYAAALCVYMMAPPHHRHKKTGGMNAGKRGACRVPRPATSLCGPVSLVLPRSRGCLVLLCLLIGGESLLGPHSPPFTAADCPRLQQFSCRRRPARSRHRQLIYGRVNLIGFVMLHSTAVSCVPSWCVGAASPLLRLEARFHSSRCHVVCCEGIAAACSWQASFLDPPLCSQGGGAGQT